MDSNWLNELFIKQDKLDKFIEDKRCVKGSLDEKFCAFMIELGEFLNEVKAFKYWSDKPMILSQANEEFVDGLHFLLTLGNMQWGKFNNEHLQKEIEKIKFNPYSQKDEDSRRDFVSKSNGIFIRCRTITGTREEYEDFFISYMRLGLMVGMTIDDIIEEYNKKNEINYQRQRDGY